MDYKYIEQLLEKYWSCETSVDEERILRAFFVQDEVPTHLCVHKELFLYDQVQLQEGLDESFDQKVLEEIECPVVKAQRITLKTRLMPLFKAAAIVAIVISLAGLAQQSFSDDSEARTLSINTPLYEVDSFEVDKTNPVLNNIQMLASRNDGMEYYLESLDIIDNDSNRFEGVVCFDYESGNYRIMMKKK